MLSYYLCDEPNLVYLDEHPFADPPVLPPKFVIGRIDDSDPVPEEELQEVIVEIDKPAVDYTARDWYGYFKKVPKLYWIIFGVVLLLPIIFGLIFCCCTREPKYTTPTPRFQDTSTVSGILMSHRQ